MNLPKWYWWDRLTVSYLFDCSAILRNFDYVRVSANQKDCKSAPCRCSGLGVSVPFKDYLLLRITIVITKLTLNNIESMYQKCIKWQSVLPDDLSVHYFTHVDKTHTKLTQFACTTYPRILLIFAPILCKSSWNTFTEVACIHQTTWILIFAHATHLTAFCTNFLFVDWSRLCADTSFGFSYPGSPLQ